MRSRAGIKGAWYVVGVAGLVAGVLLALEAQPATADTGNYQCKGISACEPGSYTCTVYCGTGKCSCTNSDPQ